MMLYSHTNPYNNSVAQCYVDVSPAKELGLAVELLISWCYWGNTALRLVSLPVIMFDHVPFNAQNQENGKEATYHPGESLPVQY